MSRRPLSSYTEEEIRAASSEYGKSVGMSREERRKYVEETVASFRQSQDRPLFSVRLFAYLLVLVYAAYFLMSLQATLDAPYPTDLRTEAGR